MSIREERKNKIVDEQTNKEEEANISKNETDAEGSNHDEEIFEISRVVIYI